MSCSARHTRPWNGVPPGSTGTSKARSRPAKYAVSCAATSRNGRASSVHDGSGASTCRPRTNHNRRSVVPSPASSSEPIGLSMVV